MTNHIGSGQALRRPLLLIAEAGARRILAYETGTSPHPAELAAAGEHIYLQLRARFAILLGGSGFDALWARALLLAQPTFRSSADAATTESFPTETSRAYGLHTAVTGHDSTIIQQNLVIAFAEFITLLCIFIGEELSLRFIHQLWPDLPPEAATSPEEEAPQ